MNCLHYPPNRNIGAWHDSITLQELPRINIGVQYMKYTSEHIPKLQIHQHSLLTRKVLFQHNFQHWSSSLYRLDHLVIFIFKLYSSSSHLRLQVFFITGSGSLLDPDHHCWIIITAGSSSLYHHQIWIISWFGSSSSLDHHHIWIITISRLSSSLDHHHRCYLRMVLSLDYSHHRKFYRASPFSCWL